MPYSSIIFISVRVYNWQFLNKPMYSFTYNNDISMKHVFDKVVYLYH